MISSNNEVLNKIDALYQYSHTQLPRHDYVPFIDKLKTAVNGYFNRDRSSYHQTLHELQILLYSDIQGRNTVYDPPRTDLNYDTNYPTSYNDFSTIFYTFPLMNCDNSTFHNAWVYEWVNVDEKSDAIYWRALEKRTTTNDDGEEVIELGDVVSSWDNERPFSGEVQYQQQIVVKNTLIDEWIEDINKQTNDSELSGIESLKSWLGNASMNAYDVMLWEDMGDTVNFPKTPEIANRVFINMKWKQCTEYLHLPVRIPSYL